MLPDLATHKQEAILKKLLVTVDRTHSIFIRFDRELVVGAIHELPLQLILEWRYTINHFMPRQSHRV
jgi:hypothetical protein